MSTAGPAAIVVVDDGAGNVLTVSRGGCEVDLAFPGGHIEPGEDPRTAAARELLEETGITATGFVKLFEAESSDEPKRTVYVYRASIGRQKRPEPRSEPGEFARWATPSELSTDACRFAPFVREHHDQLFGHLRGDANPFDVIRKVQLDLSPDDVHLPGATTVPIAPPHPRHIPTPRWPLGAQMSDAAKKRRAERVERRKARQRTRVATRGTPRIHVRAELGVGGHLHVRHTMNDKDGERLDLTFELADLTDDDAPVWNQVACVGAFRGHPAGPFELTPSVFEEIVKNWEAGGRRPIPIDYEHASEASNTSGNIPVGGAPAQGWITRLENRGRDGLWGLVEWLPQAREQIRSKQYRFFSPAIRFGSRDKVTGRPIGARLTSGALTNQPFLDALPALAASDKPGAKTMSTLAFSAHEYMPKLRACMKLPETATCDEMLEQVDRLRDHFAKCNGNARAMVDGVNLADYLPAMRDAVGANMSATWDQVFDAVEDMIDSAIDVHEITKHDAPDGPDAKTLDDVDTDTSMTAHTNKTIEAATAIESDKTGDIAMADEKNALQLKDTEISTLKLTLRERDTEIDTLRTDNKTLKDAQSKRDDEDIEREVAEAVLLYGKTKGIVEADKPELVTLLKAAPVSFRKLYPPVKPEQRHLLTAARPTQQIGDEVTNKRPQDGPGSLQLSDKDVMLLKDETLMQTTKRLMKDKKLNLEDAQDQAVKLHRDLATVA